MQFSASSSSRLPLGAHVYGGGGDDFLPDGVDGRVGNLGKQLLEVLEQRRAGVGSARPAGCPLPMAPVGSAPFCAMGRMMVFTSS